MNMTELLKQTGKKATIFWLKGHEEPLWGIVARHPSIGDAEDIARAFAKKKGLRELAGGYSDYPNEGYSTIEAKKFIIPASFSIKKPVHEPDFIDRLIAYEGGEMSYGKETKFLKEVRKKGLTNKLQGRYGTESKRRGI